MTEALLVADFCSSDALMAIWGPRRTPPDVFLELPSTYGTPDIVLCDPCADMVGARLQIGIKAPLTNSRLLSVLVEMKCNRPVSYRHLASKVNGHGDGLRRVLDELVDIGHVIHIANETYVRRSESRSIISRTIGIEAKLHDWRHALYQASRYRLFAHQSYVLLPQRHITAAANNADRFARAGVGLAGYSDGQVEIVVRADEIRPLSFYAATWLGEAVFSRVRSGDYSPER